MKLYEEVIEQLGGYDIVKEAYTKLIKNGKDLITCGKEVFVGEEIKVALLEYRRENKFFEEGDFVTYMWLDNKVDKYNPECIIKSPWRHSTDEEIEAYKHLN